MSARFDPAMGPEGPDYDRRDAPDDAGEDRRASECAMCGCVLRDGETVRDTPAGDICTYCAADEEGEE